MCHIQTLKKDVQCEEASPLKTTPQGAKQVDNASKQSIDKDELANLSKTPQNVDDMFKYLIHQNNE